MFPRLPFSLYYLLPYHSWHFLSFYLWCQSQWPRNDHHITTLFKEQGNSYIYLFVVFCGVNFIGVFRILFDLCSCSLKYFSCWRVNILKSLVTVRSLFWPSHYWRLLGNLQNILMWVFGPIWSQVTGRISLPNFKQDGITRRGTPHVIFSVFYILNKPEFLQLKSFKRLSKLGLFFFSTNSR